MSTSNEIHKESLSDWPNALGFTGLDEERGPIELTVTGNIPVWVAGTLYRTGPGQSEVKGTPKGTFRVSHWFDGFGHTHKFDIVPLEPPEVKGNTSVSGGDDGPGDVEKGKQAAVGVRVIYSSRRQSDTLVNRIKKTGTMGINSFGQRRDPCIGLFGKFMATFRSLTSVDRQAQTKMGLGNVAITVLRHPPTQLPISSQAGKAGKALLAGVGHRSATKPMWQLTDTSLISQVDPATLEPLGFARQEQLHPDLVGPLSCAHAAVDPVTGDLYNFNLQFGAQVVYRVFCIRADTGRTEVIARFSSPTLAASYTHSFFLTERFVVLCLAGAHVGLNGAAILLKGNLVDALQPFDAAKPTRWVFVDRTTELRGVVALYETPASFFFHSVNAFEAAASSPAPAARRVTCDLVEYPNLDVMKGLYYDVLLNREGKGDAFWADEAMRENSLPRLARYTFDVPTGGHGTNEPFVRFPQMVHHHHRKGSRASSSEPGGPAAAVIVARSPEIGELPTINPAYATRPYRYVYSLAKRCKSTFADTVVKTDVEAGRALLWEAPHGHTPGEAIFVARPPATASEEADLPREERGLPRGEDDGCLLVVVLDGHEGRSYLLCLDAGTMKELGRAECRFPVALGFHGVHVQEAGPGGDGEGKDRGGA